MDIHGISRAPLRKRPPFSRLVYEDGKILESSRHSLRGRPDMVFQTLFARRLLPMELKSGNIIDTPHLGDIMQLAAYFIIIEEAMGKRPPYGFLRYNNACSK